jgi:hypothetical protein
VDDVSFTHATDEQLSQPLPPPTPWPAGSFEGLLGPYEFSGRSIAARPGMKFIPPAWLIDPALLIADRTLLPIATSGSTVAQTPEREQYIMFNRPASRVSLNIAPERLWLAPPANEVPIYVVAYAEHGEIKRTLVPWRNMNSLEELLAYRMEKVEFNSAVPITHIGILSDYGRVFFDDVTITDFEYFVAVPSNPALDGFIAEVSEHSNIGWHAYPLNCALVTRA